MDSKSREIALSIKALQVAEEKQALKDYGSVDSGASLGDILGAALEEKAKTENKSVITEDKEEKTKPKSQKAKSKKEVKTKPKSTAKKPTSKDKADSKKDNKE